MIELNEEQSKHFNDLNKNIKRFMLHESIELVQIIDEIEDVFLQFEKKVYRFKKSKNNVIFGNIIKKNYSQILKNSKDLTHILENMKNLDDDIETRLKNIRKERINFADITFHKQEYIDRDLWDDQNKKLKIYEQVKIILNRLSDYNAIIKHDFHKLPDTENSLIKFIENHTRIITILNDHLGQYYELTKAQMHRGLELYLKSMVKIHKTSELVEKIEIENPNFKDTKKKILSLYKGNLSYAKLTLRDLYKDYIDLGKTILSKKGIISASMVCLLSFTALLGNFDNLRAEIIENNGKSEIFSVYKPNNSNFKITPYSDGVMVITHKEGFPAFNKTYYYKYEVDGMLKVKSESLTILFNIIVDQETNKTITVHGRGKIIDSRFTLEKIDIDTNLQGDNHFEAQMIGLLTNDTYFDQMQEDGQNSLDGIRKECKSIGGDGGKINVPLSNIERNKKLIHGVQELINPRL